MADDTRQPYDLSDAETNKLNAELEARRARRKPKHEKGQAGKMWDALYDPKNSPNEMPGGTYNSAGGKPKAVTWLDAFDFSKLDPKKPPFYQTSCGRDSLLVGIGAGASVGGIGLVIRGLSSTLLTSNLAVGAFTIVATGMYYACDQRMREESRGMAMAITGMKKLNEKKAREKAEAEAALKQAEEEMKKAQSWSNKLKFW